MEKRRFPIFTCYSIASLFALVFLGIGIFLVVRRPHLNWQGIAAGWYFLSVGTLTLIAVMVSWPIAAILSSARLLDRHGVDELSAALIERLDQMSILLNLMSEQQLLSDRAKSVAFREKDRDALHRAIHEETARQDWDTAFALADDVERIFGYRTEAERLRGEIRAKRQDSVRRQINDVVAVIDRHTRSEQWNGALREAERLMGMFPDNEQVKNLPHEIDARRQAHKKQLLTSWQEAVARHDVDGSIEILKQLDPYLTPPEAESMQETARGVFKEKLSNLGSTFSNAIRDHKWSEAIKVGDEINREFPNSRIAQEVRDKMDLLKQRAAEPATTAPVAANA